MTDRQNRIAQLERELAALRIEKETAAAEARKAFVPKYTFSIEIDTRDSAFYHLFEGACCTIYKLTGTLVNKAEAEAVGSQASGGSHSYLYNNLNDSFICGLGGGRLFLSNGAFREDQAAFDALANFIQLNPEGGDVTELVNSHMERLGKK